MLDQYNLEPADKATIICRFDILRGALRDAPKSVKWKMCARVGDKVQWYELPEEVKRG